jgi:hypothetical protein
LHRRGKAIPLPPKVFDALLLFVRNAERLVRRDELIETLWPDTHVSDANLTNVIVTLRKVLGRESIQTCRHSVIASACRSWESPAFPRTYSTLLQAKELLTERLTRSSSATRKPSAGPKRAMRSLQ